MIEDKYIKILEKANDLLKIQGTDGNYNYDSYMLGLFNGMEMIVAMFEEREPKLINGNDVKFLHEPDYKGAWEELKEYFYKVNKEVDNSCYDIELNLMKNIEQTHGIKVSEE